MSDANKRFNVSFILLVGTVLAEAHGIRVVAKGDVEVEVETESYDMAAEVLVGAGRPDLLPRLEHKETIVDSELGSREVTVRYNPIGQRMIQEAEHAQAEAEHIDAASKAQAEEEAQAAAREEFLAGLSPEARKDAEDALAKLESDGQPAAVGSLPEGSELKENIVS